MLHITHINGNCAGYERHTESEYILHYPNGNKAEKRQGIKRSTRKYNNYENKKAQESSDILMESIRLSIVEEEFKEEVTDPFDEEMKIKEIILDIY